MITGLETRGAKALAGSEGWLRSIGAVRLSRRRDERSLGHYLYELLDRREYLSSG
jgi:hypothetical protein